MVLESSFFQIFAQARGGISYKLRVQMQTFKHVVLYTYTLLDWIDSPCTIAVLHVSLSTALLPSCIIDLLNV